MASLPLRQSDAAKWTRAALAATVVAGAAAVIIFVLPKPRETVDPNAVTASSSEPTGPTQQRRHPTDALGPQRWSTVSDTMLALQERQPELEQWWRTQLAIRERQQQEEAAVEGDTNGMTVENTGGVTPTWRYIGLMWNGSQPLAIVTIDSIQHLVGVGDKPITNDPFVVESIDAEKVVVTWGRGRRYEIKRLASDRGDLLRGAEAYVDPNEGVFGDQTGVGRRANTTRPRNNPR
ncbi:MAG: hypothetical protein ACTS27_00680 [Phycisphaerales bacterium]